jgi:hypothetical protein
VRTGIHLGFLCFTQMDPAVYFTRLTANGSLGSVYVAAPFDKLRAPLEKFASQLYFDLTTSPPAPLLAGRGEPNKQ